MNDNENLEWCTDAYNISVSTALIKHRNNIKYEKVVIVDNNDNVIKSYDNYIIISRELKVPSWNIRQVCIRNRNHSSGHHSYHGVIYKFEADVIKNRTSKNIL